jgi:Spy/CpxP family protein refolding chaperone
MRSNFLVGAAGAALALGVVALLGASPGMPNPRHGAACHGGSPHARLEARLGDLALDADTRAKAEHLLAQARTEGKSRWEELRDARRAMRDLLEQDTPAVEPLMAQADAIGALETEAHKAKLRTLLELRALLGPEQWQALKSSLHHERGEPMEKS